MSIQMGFHVDPDENKTKIKTTNEPKTEPRRSLVRVYFEERGASYSYYNDTFDLKCGDFVWVEGKLEGIRGMVTEVAYNFKIRLSDYKKVIGVADTRVVGEMNFFGPCFLSFDGSMPFSQIRTWFLPPESDDDSEIISGYDDAVIPLHDLSDLEIAKEIAERGVEYCENNRVAYLGINHGAGRAIVEGSKPYVVEFTYKNGEISGLTCDCYCTGVCKHEFAVLLVLREMIRHIEQTYPNIRPDEGCLSAVRKTDFFRFVIDSKSAGSFVLS